MKRVLFALSLALCIVVWLPSSLAQQASTAGSAVIVPHFIRFAGVLKDSSGHPRTGMAGITFSLYREQEGGAPLWLETQNAALDSNGHYEVLLGAEHSEGVPTDLFTSGEARWLCIQVQGQALEQPRVLLVSVPYALKAADAETVGGLPPSAFVLAAAPVASSAGSATSASTTAKVLAIGTTPVTTAGGAVNKLAKFDAKADITNSQVFDNGTNVGIGNTAPGAKLDVSGTGIFRGALSLPATGAASSSLGKNSQPFSLTASSFNSGTAKAVNQTFLWQAEPAGNNTTSPSGKLNLLFASGNGLPAETGLSISSKGLLVFPQGQTFPGTGPGTVTSVALSAPASDFTVSGSPVTGTGTLGLSWVTAPTAGDVGNAIVKRDAKGSFATNVVTATAIGAHNVQAKSINSTFVIAMTGSTDFPINGATGVQGLATGASGNTFGVTGTSQSPTGVGVFGSGPTGVGVFGSGGSVGVQGQSSGIGVLAQSISGLALEGVSDGGDAIDGISHSGGGSGVNGTNDAGGDGVFGGVTNGGFAAFFLGNVDVDGTLSKGGGSFKIDHPLDPANKYLYHSFVESPDMMNIYNGVAQLNANGEASIVLPEWFEALNRDFRYQLTAIGAPGPNLYVAEKVHENQFKIAGGQPGMEVSWQVTGIRHDRWAEAYRIPVEQDKPARERGFYRNPELYGAPKEKGIAWARHPQLMKRMEEHPARLSATAKGSERPVKQ